MVVYENLPNILRENGVDWSVDQKERIKGAFFLGYVVMQVGPPYANLFFINMIL